MKNRKSQEPGCLNVELIKATTEVVQEMLVTVFKKCLNGEGLTGEYKTTTITSIYI